MKDFLAILRRNFVSPIVIAIFILATTLLVLGERRDAWFISIVIIVNTLIAIVQEVRAQRALKKLELMSAPHARRRTSRGDYEEVMYDALEPGDQIRLLSGDEVPADGEVIEGQGLEVNESMLTGESAPVEKSPGSVVYAASIVVAGGAVVRVTAVGAASKAGTMTASLKRYIPQVTPLQRAIGRAITILTYGALILAVLIFFVYYTSGYDAIKIFKTITSAAVTVVPEGLLLASSLLLAFGSIKLAQAKVLPQKLSAIEAMALLSVLCVDKTGTLTSDDITFESLELFKGRVARDETHYQALVGMLAEETGEGNATGLAIAQALRSDQVYEVLETLAFSSTRKLSGVRLKVDNEVHTLIMGAPEYVAEYAPLSAARQRAIAGWAAEGKRVLYVVGFDDHDTGLKKLLPKSGWPLGLILLSNPLREGVIDTVQYLQNNGVSLRVISGDNPATVRYVAAQAGIKNPDRIITGGELAGLTEEAWQKTVSTTTIFARVLPEQKERLIQTFMSDGQFTGMVGDGVNDALALKKADLGVAMFAGAAASRRVADIVLLNNSFTSLPLGMKLGNRIMQAVELIAVLFFHKITYAVVLLLTTLILGMTYPFAPRHVTFMNIFLVSLPTLMWTLFPPSPQHRINPMHFWRDTLFAVLPIAAISGVVVTVFYWFASRAYPNDELGVATSTVLVATFFGVYMVFIASLLLGVVYDQPARLARLGYIAAVVVVAVVSFGFPLTRNFFDFTTPAFLYIWPAVLMVVLAALVQYQLALRAGRRLRQER
jgi:cation-transporting ATPase E